MVTVKCNNHLRKYLNIFVILYLLFVLWRRCRSNEILRAKWDAWTACAGVPVDSAMKEYIGLVEQLEPGKGYLASALLCLDWLCEGCGGEELVRAANHRGNDARGQVPSSPYGFSALSCP